MRIIKQCRNCQKDFHIPQCRDWREHCCSSACKKAHAATEKEKSIARRTRICLQCSTSFVARQTQIDVGQGKFCSKGCGIKFNHDILNSSENVAKRVSGMLQAHTEGRVHRKSGPDHPDWTGGPEASLARAKPFMAEKLRAYRKSNPHKVREFSKKRHGRKTGRLPRGFVAKLFELQRKKCAICKCSVVDKYHVDHITALARGGKHEPNNIQLLCPTCNVRKSAKDPIEYMQSRGFLL